jgi:hypothetical protein
MGTARKEEAAAQEKGPNKEFLGCFHGERSNLRLLWWLRVVVVVSEWRTCVERVSAGVFWRAVKRKGRLALRPAAKPAAFWRAGNLNSSGPAVAGLVTAAHNGDF